jgi:hypothetical protein
LTVFAVDSDECVDRSGEIAIFPGGGASPELLTASFPVGFPTLNADADEPTCWDAWRWGRWYELSEEGWSARVGDRGVAFSRDELAGALFSFLGRFARFSGFDIDADEIGGGNIVTRLSVVFVGS